MNRRVFSKILLAVMAILALFFFSRGLLGQGRSEDAFERVKEVQEKHTDQLMAIEGVVGTAVGLGEGTGHAVLVLLERPGVGGIPDKLEGVQVRPVITGKIYALPKPTNPGGGKPPKEPINPAGWFERPVPIGVSTGHPNITAGTIGCRVKKGGNVYALSNNHVYADENNGVKGVDPVLQPGPYDGGQNPSDAIGVLEDFEPIAFSTSANNTIDAAIAAVIKDGDTLRVGNATPSDGYGMPKSAPTAVRINQAVQKYGRSTGLTKGKVYALNATLTIGYDNGDARFVNQIVIIPGGFSAPGDSGSLILSNERGIANRKPVGLLFAGSDLVTIANPIQPVLDRFGVTIDGE